MSNYWLEKEHIIYNAAFSDALIILFIQGWVGLGGVYFKLTSDLTACYHQLHDLMR